MKWAFSLFKATFHNPLHSINFTITAHIATCKYTRIFSSTLTSKEKVIKDVTKKIFFTYSSSFELEVLKIIKKPTVSTLAWQFFPLFSLSVLTMGTKGRMAGGCDKTRMTCIG